MSLFDLIEEPPKWEAPTPPSLDGITEVMIDCETTGLRWWEKDRPIGLGIYLPSGVGYYLPWGHRGGGNLQERQVKDWALRELRGKHIVNLNTRFDVHMLHAWGVDLEAQGCTVSDVGHYAALLDDHRKRFSLADLVKDLLTGEEKVTQVNGMILDPTRMADYHAGVVAVRAIADVRQVWKLKELMLPEMDKQDLMRVKKLEDELIYVVCEMERNGCPIDMELLYKWERESEKRYHKLIAEIRDEAGFPINPNSSGDMTRLFKKLGLPIIELTETGAPSFSDVVIKKIEHPTIKKVRQAGKLSDLRSKYLVKYKNCIGSDGILRYALHQLRAAKQEGDSGSSGTVSGRFSSTAVVDGVGVNIQQVMKTEKQIKAYGDEYLVRELHIPPPGRLFLAADAMQIEYRIFASHAKTPRVLEEYAKNPEASFHEMVWAIIKEFKPDITYRQQKDLNFAKLYGAGLVKMAGMLEFITPSEMEQLYRDKAKSDHPLLAKVVEVNNVYNRLMPEVKQLLSRASKLAEDRGYVRTILGRRMRFPGGHRLHKALNGVIQGTAADINKQKLIELHKERLYTGLTLRYTIHDEVDGDVPDEEAANRVKEVLNRQSFPELPVPILWDVGTGKNWKLCG